MSAPGVWKAGLLGRCPACGEASLFSGWMTIRDACPSCGFPLKEHDCGDGPAFFAMLGVSVLAVALAIALEVWASPPIWLHLALEAPLILLGTVLGLRLVKAVLIALQFKHKVGAFRP